jgi:hypothetical protein
MPCRCTSARHLQQPRHHTSNQPTDLPWYTVLRTVATQGSNERNKQLSKLRLAFKPRSITCTAHKRRCVGAQGTQHASSPCKHTTTTRHSSTYYCNSAS